MVQIANLYGTHGPELLRYLRRRFGGGAADELLQDVFLQAARTPERLLTARSPRAWLFVVARNLAATMIRRRRALAPLATEPEDRAPQRDARLDQVREAIASLPEPQREPLELRLVHDLNYEEIAQVLRIPVGTVRSRLHNAVRRLRELCNPEREQTHERRHA